MPARRVEDEIERLGRLRDAPAHEAETALRKALGARVNLVAAKAARVIAELGLRDLTPDLARAFDRLLEKGAERDPQCWAKNAIAKALIDLDCRDAAPFLRGIRHIQMEPVWGRLEDMAANLRGICLLALPGCDGLRREEILRRLVDALADKAYTVRVEAARGLQHLEGEESALLLRLKAHTGDEEAAVTGQVFDSLLVLERERAVGFVAGFLASASAETRGEAALALGNSRFPAAVAILREALESAREPEFRSVLFRGLCLSRQEDAIGFVRQVAAEGPPRDRAAAAEALSLLKTDSPTPSAPAPPPR
jgi:hypothetical protein